MVGDASGFQYYRRVMEAAALPAAIFTFWDSPPTLPSR